MNTFTVTIDSVNYTNSVVFPIKWGELLDERLDEANISIVQIAKTFWNPLTPVSISFYENAVLKKNSVLCCGE